MNKFKLLAGNAVVGSSLLLVSSAAMSLDTDAYLGAQLGYGFSHLNDKGVSNDIVNGIGQDQVESISNSSSTGGVGGRVYGGVMFNEFIGVEGGFAAYSRGNSTTDANIAGQSLQLKAKNDVTAIDALGVYRLPVYDRVSVNLKAGIALVMSKYELHSTVNGENPVKEGSQRANTIRPKFAVGADYELTNNLSIGAAYEITPGNGNPFDVSDVGEDVVVEGNNRYSPRLQLFTVNVMYSFK